MYGTRRSSAWARGHLYEFHHLIGHGDVLLGQAVADLRAAGEQEAADRLAADALGRDVLQGRWTFQIVEEFDDGYYQTFKAAELQVRSALLGGRRHVAESLAKEREQDEAGRSADRQ